MTIDAPALTTRLGRGQRDACFEFVLHEFYICFILSLTKFKSFNYNIPELFGKSRYVIPGF